MIDVKTEDGIATVTMRHGKANALDITQCESLADCFDKLRASDARAVVLTGQEHIFSAGVDLLQVSAGGADYLDRSAKSRTVFSALSGTHLLACRATC
jgi:enoyl-CoA hydratase